MSKLKKRLLYVLSLLILGNFLLNAINIYRYSSSYSEHKSDVVIVLGAGTSNGIVSPIFRERINHGIYLYNKQLVKKIIFTGGFSEGNKQSDSQLAKMYALKKGIPSNDILIEERSRFTIENLRESKLIMDSLGLKTALIVSDPLHMKRSITLAVNQKINCRPSPTKTSRYKSLAPKIKSLIYEAFYYSLGQIKGVN
jgi:uncharacterized SAM-binding protein YcdF (DUF218 family)